MHDILQLRDLFLLKVLYVPLNNQLNGRRVTLTKNLYLQSTDVERPMSKGRLKGIVPYLRSKEVDKKLE